MQDPENKIFARKIMYILPGVVFRSSQELLQVLPESLNNSAENNARIDAITWRLFVAPACRTHSRGTEK